MMAASITVTGTTLAPGAPVVLFPTARRRRRRGHANRHGNTDVGPDGRFLINVLSLTAPPRPITLLMNWKPEGKK